MKPGDKVWHINWAGRESVVYECALKGRHGNGKCIITVQGIDFVADENDLYRDENLARKLFDDYMEKLAQLRKVVIIGSNSLKEKIAAHKAELESAGHCVFVPAQDDHVAFTTLDICEHNRQLIRAADVVHLIWDGRSSGTIFDFGMAFALNKKFKIIYIERRSFSELMNMYQDQFSGVFSEDHP